LRHFVIRPKDIKNKSSVERSTTELCHNRICMYSLPHHVINDVQLKCALQYFGYCWLNKKKYILQL